LLLQAHLCAEVYGPAWCCLHEQARQLGSKACASELESVAVEQPAGMEGSSIGTHTRDVMVLEPYPCLNQHSP
jgi:hypothetical protein